MQHFCLISVFAAGRSFFVWLRVLFFPRNFLNHRHTAWVTFFTTLHMEITSESKSSQEFAFLPFFFFFFELISPNERITVRPKTCLSVSPNWYRCCHAAHHQLMRERIISSIGRSEKPPSEECNCCLICQTCR